MPSKVSSKIPLKLLKKVTISEVTGRNNRGKDMEKVRGNHRKVLRFTLLFHEHFSSRDSFILSPRA